MKEIELSQGKVALVDDEDYEYLNQWKWCALKSHNVYYAVRTVRHDNMQTTQCMHRLILNCPSGMKDDHRNGDGLDNRRDNLRICTNAENIHNSRVQSRNKSSRFKGVHLHKAKWCSRIKVNGVKIHLGYFISEYAAADAYDLAAKKYFGEFARLNFESV